MKPPCSNLRKYGFFPCISFEKNTKTLLETCQHRALFVARGALQRTSATQYGDWAFSFVPTKQFRLVLLVFSANFFFFQQRLNTVVKHTHVRAEDGDNACETAEVVVLADGALCAWAVAQVAHPVVQVASGKAGQQQQLQ